MTNQATPVVMVTTEAEKDRVMTALKAGANNYIVKPFTPEILLEKLQKTIAVSSKRPAAPAATQPVPA